MSSNIFKPENALKRADELILVGQPLLAFQNLHDLIMSKKLRFNLSNYEAIMLRYVSLAVNMRKGKYAKEALTQYRNQILYSNLNSFDYVINSFVENAENKVPSDIKVVADVEDFESSETPEKIISKILNGNDEDDEVGQQTLRTELEDNSTRHIRFLWEAYRISLDIVRNNSKMENFYRLVASKSFEFCEKFGRKTEFRRLCEVLRNHLSQIIKGVSISSPQFAISLSNVESLTIQMQIRFNQLNTAIQLEVWPEALKSVEDIYELLNINKKNTIDHQLMINYYEALTKIFRVSGNSLFHAAAWNKYLSFVGSRSSSLSHAKLSELTSCTLLSALSVPTHPVLRSPFQDLLNESPAEFQASQHTKDCKISALMGLSKIPTRDQLILDATSSKYYSYIDSDIKALYEILSNILQPSGESPYELSEKLFQILLQFSSKPLYTQFIPFVQKAIFSILFEKVVITLTEISFEALLKIASNIFLNDITFFDLEILLLQETEFYSSSYRILIDDHTKMFYIRATLHLESLMQSSTNDHLISIDHEEDDQPFSSESNKIALIENRISSFSSLLNNDLFSSYSISEMVQTISEIDFILKKEQHLLQAKKDAILKQKQTQEAAIKAKELKEASERAERLAQEQEQRRIQRIEQLEALEQERKCQELREIQFTEKKKLIDQVVQKVESFGKSVDIDHLLTLSRDEIFQKQSELLAEGKGEVEKKISAMAKRMDHVVRACRQEEHPLILKDYEGQRKIDESSHATLMEKKRHLSASKHALQMTAIQSAKTRLQEAMCYFEELKHARLVSITPLIEARKIELEAAKQMRIEEYKKKKAHEEVVLLQKAKEAEADVRRHKQEKAQRAREAEIEAKLEREKAPSNTTTSAYVPPWKRRAAN